MFDKFPVANKKLNLKTLEVGMYKYIVLINF